MNIADLDTVFDLEYFIDLSPDLICIAGYDGYFKKINPAVSRTLGYSEEELLAYPINFFVHPDDREITSQSRQTVKDDNLLLNFENRYISKTGDIIRLLWTTKLIKRDKLIFGIAKRIIQPKKPADAGSKISFPVRDFTNERLQADQLWLNAYEEAAKKYIGNMDLSVRILSYELGMSERQVFRRVKRILGITPNKLIKKIRLQVATDAIATGRYTTLAEISSIAGFDTPAYFSKLFTETYGINVLDVLNNGRSGHSNKYYRKQ